MTQHLGDSAGWRQSSRRLGPNLILLAHDLGVSVSLQEWTRRRRFSLADARPQAALASRIESSAPVVYFAEVADALRWFRGADSSIAYTWALEDGRGIHVAESSWAFPTIVMAERDARTIQEFAEDLTLHFITTEERHTLWNAERDRRPVLHSPEPYSNREDALRAATVAVGLLPVASVAAHAIAADEQRR
ncbi:hypothetical protein GCM10009766_20240 [Microcella frigidaquae]